jgi:multidrug transporter EmrE-like cation transporter
MLKSFGAYIISITLALVSSNAFRQVLPEFRAAEPGSMLFCALQVVIGLSAAVAAVGVFKRARWAARCIGICGIAAVGLLVSQPLFEPMKADAKHAIWFGAAVVGVVATGMAWFARRLAAHAAASRAPVGSAQVWRAMPRLLPDAQQLREPIIATVVPHVHVPRAASTPRDEDALPGSGAPTPE